MCRFVYSLCAAIIICSRVGISCLFASSQHSIKYKLVSPEWAIVPCCCVKMRWKLLEGKEQLFCDHTGCWCLVISVHLRTHLRHHYKSSKYYLSLCKHGCSFSRICQLFSLKHTVRFIPNGLQIVACVCEWWFVRPVTNPRWIPSYSCIIPIRERSRSQKNGSMNSHN